MHELHGVSEPVPHIVGSINLEFPLKIINDDNYPRPEVEVGKWKKVEVCERRIEALVEGVPFLLGRKEPGRDVVP